MINKVEPKINSDSMVILHNDKRIKIKIIIKQYK